jgi:transcriptional regulator with XRE-family HTH domain
MDNRMELKMAMKVAGLTQADLAKRAGVSPALITRLLDGSRRRPSYESIVRIARALNLAPDELFPIDTDTPRNGSKRSRRASPAVPPA